MQVDIFGKIKSTTPKTEGIKYAGSKLKLLTHITQTVAELDVKNVLDGFSGTTRVSQAFAKLGFNTTANDVSAWSEVFATCYLLNDKPAAHFQKIIDHLNGLVGYDGWFTQHYGGDGNDASKKPFQKKNTQKLDAIREEIERMSLTKLEKAVALTSLILALDSVDSTLGHYAAYLARWSPRSYKTMQLKLPALFIANGSNNVLRGDVLDAAQKKDYDLAYFDPPYGSNNEKMPPSRVRYASYYHIWTSIIQYDKPALFGKAMRREDTRDKLAGSVYEEFRKDESGNFIAMQAIRQLIEKTHARYILLSYSSGGRATKTELTDILTQSGKLVKALEIDYKHNVMANMRWTNEWINSNGKHREYLFLVEKK